MSRKKTSSYELIFGVNNADAIQRMGEIDSSMKKTDSYYRLLKKGLDQAWDTSNWIEARKISAKSVEDTSEKVQLLKKRLNELENEGGTSDNAKKAIEQLKRELVNAQNEALAAKKRLDEINNLRMEQIKKTIQQVSDKLSSVGNKLTLGLTAPIVAAGAASVKMASDMNESINKVDTSFGAAAGIIHEFSNQTLLSYGIAKSSALEMAAFFGDMATSMGFSQQEAADMSKQLVALAGDLASFKNISVSEAQTALASIFTGETETLKRLGVVMTEVNLNAAAMEYGLNKTTQEMSQNEKVALRMQYVLDSTKNSQGDFAKTSDSTANQLRILTESLKELAAVAGQELIPMVTPIISKINGIIQSVGKLDDGTKDMIIKVATFAAAFGPLLSITGKLTGAVNSLISAYTALKSAQAAAAAGQSALNIAMAGTGIGAIISVVGVLISALGSLAVTSALTEGNIKSLGQKVDDIADSFSNAEESAKNSAIQQEDELKFVEKLLPKYEELNGKVEKTATEKAELSRVVNDINTILPDSIKLLNEEKGIYDGLPDAIKATITAKREEIQIIQERAAAMAAIEAQSKLMAESGFGTIDEVMSEISYIDKFVGGLNGTKETDNSIFSWLMSDKQKAKIGKVDRDRLRDLKKLAEDYSKYQKIIDGYANGEVAPSVSSDVTGESKIKYTDALKNYQSARKELERQRKMDKISDEQFYESLLSIANKHLNGYAELTDTRLDVDVEIYQYRKSLREKELEEEKKAAEELAAAKKQALQDYQDFSDKVIAQAEKEANAKIAAIDAELAAREKLKAAQEKEIKLQQAVSQLAFTRDADSRSNLQREISRLQKEIKESKIQSDAEAEKAAVQAELAALKQNVAAMTEQAKNAITPESINPYITQLAPQLSVNASGMSEAQALQLIQRAFQKLLYGM